MAREALRLLRTALSDPRALKSLYAALRETIKSSSAAGTKVISVSREINPASEPEYVTTPSGRRFLATSPEGEFILATREVAAENFNNRRKAIFGLPVLQPTESTVARYLEESLVNRPEVVVMNERPFPEPSSVNPFAGQVVSFARAANDNASRARAANADEVRDASVIMIPGLGGGSGETNLRRTFKELRKLFPDFPEKDFLIYTPEDEGVMPERRYYRGAMPYVDRNAFNVTDSGKFLEAVFRKKFCDEKGVLLPPDQCDRFIIVAHSIGSREAGSHVRVLKSWLNEMGVGEEKIAQYMNKVLRIGIGSPTTEGSEKGLTHSVNYFSMNDSGVRRPIGFIRSIDINSDFYERFARDSRRQIVVTPSGGSASKALVVLAPGVIGNGEFVEDENGRNFAANPLGHAVRQYVEGIMAYEETRNGIVTCASFVDRDISDQGALAAVLGISANAIRYPASRPLDKKGIVFRVSALAEYQRREESVVAEARKAKLVAMPLTPCDDRSVVAAPPAAVLKAIEASPLTSVVDAKEPEPKQNNDNSR